MSEAAHLYQTRLQPLADPARRRDDLRSGKGVLAGLLMAVPLWLLILWAAGILTW